MVEYVRQKPVRLYYNFVILKHKAVTGWLVTALNVVRAFNNLAWDMH